MATTEKMVLITTTGIDNPEKAILPFVVAVAALTMDAEVVIILQAAAVMLAKNGIAETVNVPGFMPLKKLLDTFIEMGGRLLLCTPCVKERQITSEDLIPGSKLIAAATIVDETLSAKAVLTY
jgi:uncharacterized protein involved in oxidation of intracellular sulfur